MLDELIGSIVCWQTGRRKHLGVETLKHLSNQRGAYALLFYFVPKRLTRLKAKEALRIRNVPYLMRHIKYRWALRGEMKRGGGGAEGFNSSGLVADPGHCFLLRRCR